MDRNHIEKIAQTPEDKLLLVKVFDKISAGMRKNIPANTAFLSQREQELARFLCGNLDGLHYWGGYEAAQRRMLVFLPDYMDESMLMFDSSPLTCLRAKFYKGDNPTHRDFLGALIGTGVSRECIGDICVGNGTCDFFVTAEIAPFLLQNFTAAGRTKLQLEAIPVSQAKIPEENTEQIRDTLASLRLDCVIASGFHISRNQAAAAVDAGRAAIDGLPCEKAEKPVAQGAVISVRGIGKIRLTTVNGQTKKGRISVVIDRYV